MKTYYELLVRAVSIRPNATPEVRKELYNRARKALLDQLSAHEPPVAKEDIQRERRALEDDIARTEAEVAGQETGRSEDERHRAEEAAKAEEVFRLHKEVEEAKWREEELRRIEEEEETDRRDKELRRVPEDMRRPHIVRARLAEMASPAPSITPDGRLDAGPNLVYDKPTLSNDLPNLPVRQHAVITTILRSLPGNAPRQIIVSLRNYDDELKARGLQPILGLLNDMAAIIEAEVGAHDAEREWLDVGVQRALSLFNDNHALFVKHYPLDPERDALYLSMPIDESNAIGHSLSGPFEVVAKAALIANKAGLTTDDFLTIVDKFAEFAKITSTQPPPLESPAWTGSPADKASVDAASPSPKKRVLLSGFGFFERIVNLAASTTALAATPEGRALLSALHSALSALSTFIRF